MDFPSVFPQITDTPYPKNIQRAWNCPSQEVNYRQMDNQMCTPTLKLALFHKFNNGDQIKEVYG